MFMTVSFVNAKIWTCITLYLCDNDITMQLIPTQVQKAHCGLLTGTETVSLQGHLLPYLPLALLDD
eukprot:m.194049 g.194049  ORF g.194049 m.194049 type:complete len:66 (-) comp14887_c0_seq13:1730-1927(-)